MRNSLRTCVVGLLSVMMTFNPAVACHYCGGGWGGYRNYGPVYYGPVVYGGGCGGCGYEVVVDDCSGCNPCGGCGTVVTESAPVETLHQPTVAPTPAQPATPAQPQQPAHVDRPVDTAPAPQLPTNPPMPPQAEPPLPDQETNPPMPPANDLFNSAPAPTTPPQRRQRDAAGRDAASRDAASRDAREGRRAGRRLVRYSARETPAAAPAEPPAEKPAEAPAGTTPPTPPAATDDLFGGAAQPAEKAAAPAAAPTNPPAAPEAKPAEKPADKPAGEEKKADDIFGATPSVLREAGGLASDEMRQWVDNTGNFSCRGRLVRFLDGQVRLVKDNGRTTTVSLARLSANDLEFVERQASAHQASAFQTAQSMSAMPWISN